MPKRESDITPQTRRNYIKRILKSSGDEGMSITDIYNRFVSLHGDKVSRKTIERDIDEHLADHEGVSVVDEKASIKTYIISSDYAEKVEVSISEENLQVISIALGLLSKLGPKSMAEMVLDVENALVETLPNDLKKDFENFKELQTISPSNAGKSLVKNGEIIKPILTALRKGRMIECEYFSKGRGAIETREIGPVFIEMFGGEPYLLAEDPDEENTIKRFKLSRMGKVKILDTKFVGPDKKDCEEVLNSYGGVGGADNEIFNIAILGNEKLYEHFSEIELHPSQKLTKNADGSCTLEFEMPESYPFYRYMAGLGGWINHIEPKEVMWQIRAIWRKGAENMGFVVEWPERD